MVDRVGQIDRQPRRSFGAPHHVREGRVTSVGRSDDVRVKHPNVVQLPILARVRHAPMNRVGGQGTFGIDSERLHIVPRTAVVAGLYGTGKITVGRRGCRLKFHGMQFRRGVKFKRQGTLRGGIAMPKRRTTGVNIDSVVGTVSRTVGVARGGF